MALTRPRLGQLNTSIVAQSDPITVLNQGASSANVDVGFLFNRANGLVSNVAVYWSESAQSFVTAFTSNTGATNSNISPSSYANLTIGSLLSINGNIYLNGVAGTNGQYITATGAGTAWTSIGYAGGVITSNIFPSANIITNLGGTSNFWANTYTSNLIISSGIFWANGTVFSSGAGGGSYGNVQMLANLAAGSNPVVFGSNIVAASGTSSTNTTTGALVVQGGAGIAGSLYVGGIVNFTGNLITGHILPSANVTYDIGSPTLRFRTLYVSGTTIDMGGAQITTDSASGGFAFVPKPTTANPNPLGTVFSPTGGITTINTTGGIVAAGAINTSIENFQGTAKFGNVRLNSEASSTSTTTGALVVTGGAGIAGNVFAGNMLATGFFYSNGTPFVSSSYGNTDVASYLPTYTGSLAASTDITALYANAGAQSNSIAGANAAIITANTALKSYVDTQDSAITTAWTSNAGAQADQITGANAAIVSANTALKAYTDAQITTTQSWVTGANAATVTANTALKGYVDQQFTNLTNGAPAILDTLSEIATSLGNNASLSTTLLNSIAGSNAAIVTANTALKAYTDAQITTTQSWVTGANAAIVTANTALKGYTDNQISTANTALKSYVDTQDSAITTAWTSNAGAQANQIAGANVSIARIDANLGSFQTYANATFGASGYSNVQMLANLAAGSNPITFGSNITVTNTVTAANIYSTGVYIGSGSATSGLFWSANSAAISPGITYTASTSPPGYPTRGDQWYNTSTDVFYEYITDGTSSYWIDIVSTVVSSGATGATGTVANTASWIVTTNTTTSTSTTTGALQVAGGAGIAGNVFAGNVLATGFFYSNGTPFVSSGSSSSVTVTTIAPPGTQTAVDIAGGETVTATGSGFNAGITAYIIGANTVTCTTTYTNSTSASFTTNAIGAGTYSVILYNTDGTNGIKPGGITYSSPPVWVTAAGALTAGTVGSSYSQSVSATGTGIGYSVTSGALPTSLSLNSGSGEITGTPTVANTFNFTITATNTYNQTTARAFSILITNSTPTAVEYLVVAGGGGGGGGRQNYGGAGGGGAGGYRTASNFAVTSGTPITVTVGAGGGTDASGSVSVFSSITSLGGGKGGGAGGTDGTTGGSGGGGGSYTEEGTYPGGTGTAGQGNNGGSGSSIYGGGGGGAGGEGTTGSLGSTGGIGIASSISGSSTNYAGGGGGGVQGGTPGVGTFGGGSGGNSSPGSAGTANTGGGGGGGAGGLAVQSGGNGGSGVVIIRYADTFAAATSTTGSPTITVSGGYRTYKFTASGSITF